jgi:hypothetical protein
VQLQGPPTELGLLGPAAGQPEQHGGVGLRHRLAELGISGQGPGDHPRQLLVDVPAAELRAELDVDRVQVGHHRDVDGRGADVDHQDVVDVLRLAGPVAAAAQVPDVDEGGLRLRQQRQRYV